MSVLDQLRSMESQIIDRLKQLQPMVTEYEELRKAAQRLGVPLDAVDRAVRGGRAGRRATGGRASTARSTSGTRRSASGGRRAASSSSSAATSRARSSRTTRSTRGTRAGGTTRAAGSRGGARTARAGARSTGATRTRRRTAGQPKRQDQVLEAVRRKPGITVPELGKELSVDYTGLYRVVRKLEQEGQVRKSGQRLEPVGSASNAGASGGGNSAGGGNSGS